ncbi:unnamed protein product [Lactuca saligna]|uniref:Uncharacterized protein n=1 Tax=Lactuca saligna TaxID=75948 RepID=A0AA36ECH4_LACSI|nr:unnamed protein product [Lactuca saligna]
MEGIHLLNEVFFCSSILTRKQLKFEEAFQALKGMCVLHEQLEVEENDLREEVHRLSKRNKRLVDGLIGRHLGLNQELKEKTQQFRSLKLQYTKTFSQLSIACSGKDASIKLIEENSRMLFLKKMPKLHL